ncbi:MAG: FAD/FMN-containing dehydrogenase [Motiliproteus sp.]|jgi:FAD/FMN-containing dehydrogenase
MNIHQQLEISVPNGDVLFPGSKAYEEAVFIGNMLYRFQTPACVVMAESDVDVQEVVRISRKYDCKLNIKNGGHSYAGYCLNEDGIVLDLSRMHSFNIDRKSMTVTTQAGATWLQIYEGLRGENEQYMVLGGQCPTVGVSGFTLGGGLSAFSRKYGLAIDNLLSIKHVDVNGDMLELTNQETDSDNKDLFWALCGGGGGNFGVAVEFTFRIHKLPNPTVVCGELTWNIPQQTQEFKDAMDIFNSMNAPKELCIDAYWNYTVDGQFQAMMTTIYNGTMDECDKVLAPVLKYNPNNGLKSMHWTEWEHEEEGFDKFSKIYHHHVSFIMGEGAITREVTDIIMDLMGAAPALIPNPDPSKPDLNQCHILWDHIGGVTKNVASDATSFYWRDGVFVMTAMVNWQFAEQAAKAFSWTQRCKDLLTPFTLEGKAAYLNYIDSTLVNWQEAYYGKNYNRLREIKSKVDPTNFFYFKQSIEPAEDQPSHIWKNWGECVTAYPDKILIPTTLGEVISIVRDAAVNKQKIRVVGAGHSWSPLAPSKNIMLSLNNLNKIWISDDPLIVNVEPGATIDELATFFKKNAICVPSNVGHGVGEATCGGVISTGCHGSGITMKSISDYAVAFEIITAQGDIRHVDKSEPELLNAVRLSLGLFGIISKISFEVIPAFNVHVVEAKVPLQECLETIRSFVLDNDYAEISWLPFTNEMYVQKANRTQKGITRFSKEPYQSCFQKEINKASAVTALNTIVTNPVQTPEVMQSSLDSLPVYDYVSNITDYLHNADWRPILAYKVSDIEIAVEIDEGFANVRKAVLICQEQVNEWAEAGRYPFNGVLGFRFIESSAAILSPARGNKYTALIEISSYYKTDLFEEFSGRLVQILMDELPNARAHWAKGFQFMPQAKEYIRKSYEKQIEEFLLARKSSGVDPDNLFVNDYLADLFEIN